MAALTLSREQAGSILANSRWVKSPFAWVVALGCLALNGVEAHRAAHIVPSTIAWAVGPVLVLALALWLRWRARCVLGVRS